MILPFAPNGTIIGREFHFTDTIQVRQSDLLIQNCVFNFPHNFDRLMIDTSGVKGVTISGCTFRTEDADEMSPLYDLLDEVTHGRTQA